MPLLPPTSPIVFLKIRPGAIKTTDMKYHFYLISRLYTILVTYFCGCWLGSLALVVTWFLYFSFTYCDLCTVWNEGSHHAKPHQQGKRCVWGGEYSAWKTHFEVFVSVMCFRLGSTLLYNQECPWTCDFSANISWVLVPPCWEASILPTKLHSHPKSILFHSLSIFSSTGQWDSLWSWRISVPPHPTSSYNCIS